jgi:uncharacterized protein YceK
MTRTRTAIWYCLTVCAVLATLLILLALSGCGGPITDAIATHAAAQATATYGAQMWIAQQTAIATVTP